MTRPEIFRAADVLLRDSMAVTPGEELLLTVDTASDVGAANAIMASAYAMGAKVSMITLPQLPCQGALADPFIPESLAAAVGACDVWIDLCWPYLAGSHVHDEAMKRGKIRYLLAGDMGAESMHRLYGQLDHNAWFSVRQSFADILSRPKGKLMRITDPLGTDVSFTLAEMPGHVDSRRAEKPGLNFVPGSVPIAPEIESVKGVICTTIGFHEYFTRFESPVRLEIDGKIREVSGAGTERLALDRALKRAGGGEYGYVIHFTYGMHPSARRTGTSFIEEQRVIGNNAVGLGQPFWVPGGGENHPDILLSEQSIWVDGELVIEDGIAVHSGPLKAAGDALVPGVAK